MFIEAENLSKTYRLRTRGGGWLRRFVAPQTRLVRALDSVSFSIGKGELVGYIGPNGAGKSTTVKILSGILRPDGGHCTVMGMTPWLSRTQVVQRIGVLFGQRSQLWWDLPVSDSFLLLKDIYRVPQDAFRRTQDALVDLLQLSPLLTVPVRQLSLGQRMRCELAATLLHGPEILFLDEPTIGLDAPSKLAVRDFIKARNRDDGLTVILTTHDMDDIEAMCTRVLLIGGGRILMDGSVGALLDTQHERCVTARLRGPLPDGCLPPSVRAGQTAAGEWSFVLDPDQVPVPQLIALLNEHAGILDLMVERPPIDAVVAARYAQLAAGGQRQ